MSAVPAKRNHAVIAGTGRTGTSFLVRWLDACGLQTAMQGTDWSERARAGHERPLDSDAPLPYVVKDPWLFAYCDTLDLASITIDALIVPMRDLMRAARSRVQQERLAALESPLVDRDIALAATTPGGVLYSLDVIDQARILAVGFHKLVHWAAANQLPVYLLDFPRLVEEREYTLGVLWPWLGSQCSIESARRAFDEVADPSAVRITADVHPPTAVMLGEGEPDPAVLARSALLEHLDEVKERVRRLEEELQRWREQAEVLESQSGMQLRLSEGLTAELDRARAWLTEIQSSASWRITAPLRAMRGPRRFNGTRAADNPDTSQTGTMD